MVQYGCTDCDRVLDLSELRIDETGIEVFCEGGISPFHNLIALPEMIERTVKIVTKNCVISIKMVATTETERDAVIKIALGYLYRETRLFLAEADISVEGM